MATGGFKAGQKYSGSDFVFCFVSLFLLTKQKTKQKNLVLQIMVFHATQMAGSEKGCLQNPWNPILGCANGFFAKGLTVLSVGLLVNPLSTKRAKGLRYHQRILQKRKPTTPPPRKKRVVSWKACFFLKNKVKLLRNYTGSFKSKIYIHYFGTRPCTLICSNSILAYQNAIIKSKGFHGISLLSSIDGFLSESPPSPLHLDQNVSDLVIYLSLLKSDSLIVLVDGALPIHAPRPLGSTLQASGGPHLLTRSVQTRANTSTPFGWEG